MDKHKSGYINGIITSFVQNKNFGFIKGEDELDYFFHISDVSIKNNIKPGAYVYFDPTPTKKGLAAKCVSVIKNLHEYYVEPDEFILRRKGRKLPEDHEILLIYNSTAEDKDPNKAIQQLEQQAIENGMNGLVGIEVARYTAAEGNYNYTMHVAHGSPCVVMKKQFTQFEEEAERNNELLDNDLKRLREKINTKYSKSNSSISMEYIILGGFLVLLLAFAIF